MEDSAVIFRGHIIMCDNGGNLICLNLNTLKAVWVQDILDDSNGSPVLSIEDGHPYIYVSTSFHLGWRSSTTAEVPIFKIDAENGEIVWQTEYTCYSVEGISGGVQSTAAVGCNDLDDYIYVTVARTPTEESSVLVCLEKSTGEVVWEHENSVYTWSSPVCVYNSDGTGVVIYCSYGNTMFMLDGHTGEVLSTCNVQGGAEASPAVYENHIVIGIRQCKIWGIELK
ncbi:MAG: PQQ-binding-like beta-propeller repeat protein [Oscillospiraceae bacterium]|nr:PQQ-binding-like beta-propeller repeat protein [Oscillospiraceae bacterium]